MSSNCTMACMLQWLLGLVSMLVIQGLSSQETPGFKLTMTPEHYQQIDANTIPTFKVMCILRDETGQPVPLAGCGYKEYYSNYTMLFNEGPASPNYTHSYDWNTLTGKYHGRGLENGECGLAFQGYENVHYFILGCRVRSFTAGWQTAATMLFFIDWTPLQYRLEPQVRLALAGSDVTIKGKAKHALDECCFFLPPADKVGLSFISGHASANHSEGRYHGVGLSNKECGITLHNVQPERSGFVSSEVLSTLPLSCASDFIELIVATAPDDVGMTDPTTNEGGILNVTCWSKNSRPMANITWLLDDQVIRQDSTNEGPVETEWLWNHDPQSITQHLWLNVNREDNGKKLVCRVGHMALPSGEVDIRRTVNVK